MKKSTVCLITLLMIIAFYVPAKGAVVIEPSNVSLVSDTFSFDFIINEPNGVSAYSFQTTINVDGPGLLTLDETESQAVADELDYWIYGNSDGAGAIDRGGNSFEFGDSTYNGTTELLVEDDIVARYVFAWDGTAGDYTFTIDFDTNESFVYNDSFRKETLQFTPGGYEGDATGFTVYLVPEPASLMLFALGGTILLRKRKA